MDGKITPLEQVKKCLDAGENFVLQGGAGSGKTETLKQVLEYISKTYPDKKVACITHTNLAVDEIKSRVEGSYTISTIHSFLNDLIKDYKKNIHEVIFEIFKIENMIPEDPSLYASDADRKKADHDKYKKCHSKCSSMSFALERKSIGKVEGKRDYDKDPSKFNDAINILVNEINKKVEELIKSKDYHSIYYNETRFDDLNELSFGHDSLLKISYLLFKKYPLLGRILQDKYNLVFVDEYQDTNEKVVEIFLRMLPEKTATTIGLFGDSMQAIYDDGIGDVESYVSEKALTKVIKEDNYRCSKEVVDFINELRNDGLKQDVALKRINGVEEDPSTRKGHVKFYYAIIEGKPNAFSPTEQKQKYFEKLNILIKRASDESALPYKKLMLTNKSIASEVGFQNLYEVFDSRYLDAKEYIDKDLAKLQLIDLVELCNAYTKQPPNYNLILSILKKSGFSIRKSEDKLNVKKQFDTILNSEESAIKTVEKAFESKMLKKTEKFIQYVARKDAFLAELNTNKEFKEFKTLFEEGANTYTRMTEKKPGLLEEQFKELERSYRKERFYEDLFSDKIKFKEILKYYEYINEETPYITMHKTKGSGIDNVMVVLDEYFWGSYNFSSIFDTTAEADKRLKNMKLVYVACSRAKTNLICVRLTDQIEEARIKTFFPGAQKIEL